MRQLLCIFILVAVLSSTSAYQVVRNVKDFGAKGDGITDDTIPFINSLTTDKWTTYRSGTWDNSQYSCQTTMPSLVFIPHGTYKISALLPLTYYTQMVGEWPLRPTLQFYGSSYHALDAGTDEGPGNGWYGGANQNNFFHQLRNVIVDLTHCNGCTALHWQVAQATNIVNVDFLLGVVSQNNIGIFMENGSGGYMGDLYFQGGVIALNIGNQQFTLRNVTVDGSNQAVMQAWGWSFSYMNFKIRNVKEAFHFTGAVASVSVVDADISNAETAFILDGNLSQVLLENIALQGGVGTQIVIDGKNFQFLSTNGGDFVANTAVLPSATRVTTNDPKFPPRSVSLVDQKTNKYYGRTRPQYSSFVTALLPDNADATEALQKALYSVSLTGEALFVPYGTYYISKTVFIPANTRWFGQVWTRFYASGSFFSNASSPQVMFDIGFVGEVGVVEMSDFLLLTDGPAPGAVLLRWNLRGQNQGDSGLWDVHFRVGGANGTKIRPDQCPITSTIQEACRGAHSLMHITKTGSVYVENSWGWVADHDIDLGPQLNVYSARGLVSEANPGPVWLYGHAMEHSYLYQYNLVRASNHLISILQTETPYYQPEFPLSPYANGLRDPVYPSGAKHSFSLAADTLSTSAIYGASQYSFFNRWSAADCSNDPPCQQNISQLVQSSQNRLQNFNTHGSANIITLNDTVFPASIAPNGFCMTISLWN